MQESNFGVFEAGDRFRFSCHRGIACFNRCCRDVNIFLTPYDVLRMRKKLGLSSEEFLDKYTTLLFSQHTGLPVVVLKMKEDGDLTCPFLSEDGCGIYEQRPWSCRMAPVDVENGGKFKFIFDPSHCLGINEEKEWTIEEWMEDQGLSEYQKVEAAFRALTEKLAPLKTKVPDDKMSQMFYMACYDLDSFRKFVFGSKFLEVFDLPPEVVEAVKNDDLALLELGFLWLQFGMTDMHALKVKGK